METGLLDTLSHNVGLTVMARVVQVIGLPIGLAAVFWFASTVNGMQLQLARLETQMTERTSDRYTGTDARHDFATLNVHMEDVDRRVSSLELIERGRLTSH